MKRGEVWWANLRSPIFRRPVLLLSRDDSINTIPKSALQKRMCRLSPARMIEVKNAILKALDLN